MQQYQEDFIRFAISLGVLRFGDFTLKSGRNSPYFFNSGLFNTGNSLSKLGRFYAQSIIESQIEFDMLYGPAYKGIPLVSAISIALANDFHRDVPYAFNRKEQKTYGEGGNIIGSELSGKVLIVDDVISAGTSVRESVDLINENNAVVSGVSIALNRQEKGINDVSAIAEIKTEFGFPVISIVSLNQLIQFISTDKKLAEYSEAINTYREQFGVEE